MRVALGQRNVASKNLTQILRFFYLIKQTDTYNKYKINSKNRRTKDKNFG